MYISTLITHEESVLRDNIFLCGPDSESKPTYLKEMDKYHAMNCSSNTQHDRPLVK